MSPARFCSYPVSYKKKKKKGSKLKFIRLPFAFPEPDCLVLLPKTFLALWHLREESTHGPSALRRGGVAGGRAGPAVPGRRASACEAAAQGSVRAELPDDFTGVPWTWPLHTRLFTGWHLARATERGVPPSHP